MYVSPISTFFSRGRSMPAIRAMAQPCRCLCLGLRLQMMRMTPLRLITLQCSQIGFTLVRTFTDGLLTQRDPFPGANDPGRSAMDRRDRTRADARASAWIEPGQAL